MADEFHETRFLANEESLGYRCDIPKCMYVGCVTWREDKEGCQIR